MKNIAHVILYAKHWYKRSDDIIEDLKKCLSSNYMPDNKYNIFIILTRVVSQIPWMMRHGIHYYTFNLLEAISPNECWKYGYYTTDHVGWIHNSEDKSKLKPYDYQMAVIYYYLSTLCCMEIKELGGELPKPDENILPIEHPEKVKEFWS